jgi:hypothetical protein
MSAAKDFPDLQGLINSEPTQQARAQAETEFGQVPDGPGFTLDPNSHLQISFQDGVTTILFHVDLPPPFTGGTAAIYATISDTQGFQVLYGYLSNGINLGPVSLGPFAVCYRDHYSTDPKVDPCPQITDVIQGAPSIDGPNVPDKSWMAVGELNLLGNIEVDFAPGSISIPGCNAGAIPLGFIFSNGALTQAGAALNVKGGLDLFPPIPGLVTLSGLAGGFSYQQNQQGSYEQIGGCAAFNVLGIFGVTLNVFGIASNGTPVQITNQDINGLVQWGGNWPVTQHLAIGGSGEITLDLPDLPSIDLASAYGLYVDNPGAVFFGAGFCWGIPSGDCNNPPDTGISVSGGLDGAIELSNGTPFELEGYVSIVARLKALVQTTPFSGSMQAIFSYHPGNPPGGGVGLCGYVSALGLNPSLSVGHHWASDWTDILTNLNFDWNGNACGSDWLTNNSYAFPIAARDAAAGTIVHVPRGVKALDLYAHGTGGAPDVTVRGPDGISASTTGLPDERAVRRPGFVLAKMSATRETMIAVLHPIAGAYTITANPGSPALANVTEVEAVAPSVRAYVTGTGRNRALHYRVKTEHGQTVAFYDVSGQGDRLLGVTDRANGTIRFTAPTGSRTREIVAEILEGGAPQIRTVVARYVPPAMVKLATVRRLRAERRGLIATVTFARVAGASTYAIAVALGNGTRLEYTTTHTRFTLGHVPYWIGGRVTVRAVGDQTTTTDGRAASVSFAPAVQPPRLPRF